MHIQTSNPTIQLAFHKQCLPRGQKARELRGLPAYETGSRCDRVRWSRQGPQLAGARNTRSLSGPRGLTGSLVSCRYGAPQYPQDARKKNRAARDIRKGEIGHCGQTGLNEYKQRLGACDFNTQISTRNPRQRRVKSTRPPLPRGYFSRAAWVAATLPGWTHYRHHEEGPRLQAETTRPPGPREMPQRHLVRHRGPTQSSAKCLQLLYPRPFPRSALARRHLDPIPRVRLLQPRATRDKPAPPPARATPETDEAAEVAAAPVFYPSPACPPGIAKCLPCVSQSENQSQTLGGRGPGEGRRGGGGGSSGGGVNPSGTQLAERLQESGDGDDDDDGGKDRRAPTSW